MSISKERLLEILNEIIDTASIAVSPEDPCYGLTQDQLTAISIAIDIIENMKE